MIYTCPHVLIHTDVFISPHVHSLADITIGFSMSSYTVNETTESVMLTVTAQGDFPSLDLQSRLTVPVEATALVNTDDITANGRTVHAITLYSSTNTSNNKLYDGIIYRYIELLHLYLPFLTHTSNIHNICKHTAVSDYRNTTQILTFRNASSQSVLIPIINDTVVENTESFRAQLSSADDFVQFGLQSTDVLIQDDDSMISISLGPCS